MATAVAVQTRQVATERGGRRIAVGGVVFVVAMVATFATAPAWPAPDASIAELTRYATSHKSGILFGQWLLGVGLVGMIGFGAALTERVRRSASDELANAVFGATLAGVAAAGLASLALTSVASRLATDGGSSVLSLFVFGNKAYPFIDFSNAAIAGAAAFATLRHGALPRWLGVVGAVLAPAFLVSAMGLFVESGALTPFGPYSTVVFLVFLGWVLATSITLLRSRTAGE